MKKLLPVTGIFILSMAISFAQNTFKKVIQVGVEHEIGYDIISKSDKGFVVAGYYTTAAGVYKSALFTLDAQGNLQNKYSYTNNTDNGAYRFRQTSDGGYILIGYLYNTDSANYQINVLKINSSFVLSWQKEIAVKAFSWSEEPYFDVVQAVDGNIILAAHDEVANQFQAYVLKLNVTDGNVIWQNKYSQAGQSLYARSVQLTNDGGYLIGGFARSLANSNNNILLLKIKDDGSQEWAQVIGGSGTNQLGNSIVASRTGYVIAGKKLNGTTWEALLLKTDLNGTQQWSKTYADGGNEFDDIFGIDKTADGGYVIAGYVGGAGNNKEAYLVKADSAGNKKWSKIIGLSNNQDVGYSVKATVDGGIVVSGYNNNLNLWDLLVIKTDARGNDACNNFPSPSCSVPDSAETGVPVNFNATITGGTGALTFDWKGEGGVTSTSQSFTHTFAQPGTYTYYLEVKDGNSCYGICGGEITVAQGTGIHPAIVPSNSSITLFPNPFSDNIAIRLKENLADVVVELYNILGKKITELNIAGLQKGELLTWSPQVAPGIYFYQVKTKTRVANRLVQSGKLVKQ